MNPNGTPDVELQDSRIKLVLLMFGALQLSCHAVPGDDARRGVRDANGGVKAFLVREWIPGRKLRDESGAPFQIGTWNLFITIPDDELKCVLQFTADRQLKSIEFASDADAKAYFVDDDSGPDWLEGETPPHYYGDITAFVATSGETDNIAMEIRLPQSMVDRLRCMAAMRREIDDERRSLGMLFVNTLSTIDGFTDFLTPREEQHEEEEDEDR